MSMAEMMANSFLKSFDIEGFMKRPQVAEARELLLGIAADFKAIKENQEIEKRERAAMREQIAEIEKRERAAMREQIAEIRQVLAALRLDKIPSAAE